MLSQKNELLISSSFGNGYVTYLDAEIKNCMFDKQKISRKELVKILHQKGYGRKDIMEELDRQCYASTLRYMPSEDMYIGLKIGRLFWSDILERIYKQPSMVGGKLQMKDSDVKLDIFRTDFQSLRFKNLVRHLGLRQAPVMRWTKQVKKGDFLNCLDTLVGITPSVTQQGKADFPSILRMIRRVNRHKSRKTNWIWLISHIEVKFELTPIQKSVMNTLFSLCRKPVDWRGRSVSFDELQQDTNFLCEEIVESVEYLEKTGIIREVKGRLTPTGQGYFLVQYAFRPHPVVTFVVTHLKSSEYQLEISTRFQDFDVRDFLKGHGGRILRKWSTLVEFLFHDKSEAIELLDSLLGSGLLCNDR